MKLFSNANFKLRLPSWLKKEDSIVSADRVEMDKRLGTWIHFITPEKLATAMESFTRGDLEMLARIFAEIAQRDDMLINVIDKRVSSVAQLPWEIVKADDSPEAEKHKEALEYLYNNLTATSVREPEETGGVTLLLEQMMEAASTRYSVHELIWQPDGANLTLTCNHLPLWYFEGRSGKLRYKENLFAYTGIDLEPNAWMVTVGRGLIKAACIAFLCKHLPLKDWVIFCDNFGLPGVLGKTPAAYDSPEWNQMVEMVQAWRGDRAGVISSNGELEQMELKSGASFPYEKLVERMDRAMAIMYTGGDLSTIAKDNGTGSNPQHEDRDLIRNREAARLTETCNEKIDGPAIQWLFAAKPLAWFALKPPAKVKVEEEIKITNHLVGHGVPVSIKSEAARFGRSLPADDEALLTQQVTFTDKMTGAAPSLASLDPRDGPQPVKSNEAPPAGRSQLGMGLRQDFEPLAQALGQLAEGDAPITPERVHALLAKFPMLAALVLGSDAAAHEYQTLLDRAAAAGAVAHSATVAKAAKQS